jgi:surface protein
MFNNAIRFNGWVGNFDTSRVVSMNGMFGSALVFNQNIGFWNTSNVGDMSQMFDGARFFDNGHQPHIGNWNTRSVRDMSFMFRNTAHFNRDIGRWDTSQVRDMQFMFNNATAFNNGQPFVNLFWGFLNQWESNQFIIETRPWVTVHRPNPRQTMNWDVRNVTNMNSMFEGARLFMNVDIGSWDIARASTVGFVRNCGIQHVFVPSRLFPLGGR